MIRTLFMMQSYCKADSRLMTDCAAAGGADYGCHFGAIVVE